MEQFLLQFFSEVKATQTLEWVAAIFGVVSVLFAKRNHILLYPAGLVSTACYAYLLSRREAGLYAEAVLNVYYFVMTIYGWWLWQKGKQINVALLISKSNKKDWAIVFSLVGILWISFYQLLLLTPSTVPFYDAFVSATACAGMWLLAKRKLENWLLLNVSNFVAIPLFAYKGFYVTMFLTVFLFVVAIFGYLHWRKILRDSEQKIAANPK